MPPHTDDWSISSQNLILKIMLKKAKDAKMDLPKIIHVVSGKIGF